MFTGPFKIKHGCISAIVSVFSLILLSAAPLSAFEFIPPTQIVSKDKLPIKDLNLIRTKQGLTYLISSDSRYVFQGGLMDVWNGTQITSVKELNDLSDHINFDYIGIEPDKMFTLNLGSGDKKVFIFADPNCSICHTLVAKIRDSKLILSRFHVRAVITPMLKETSLPKANKLAVMAKKNSSDAISAFISNTVDITDCPDKKQAGINYNLLVAKALSIHNFPYMINPQGRIHIGMPDDIYIFLSKQ